MSFELPLSEILRIAYGYIRFKFNELRLRTNERVIVDTIYGKIKGVKWYTLYGHIPYYSFEGIPFAKPPLGDLRFKAPVEPDPWWGYKVCTRSRPKPLQFDRFINRILGSEDSLYLNVYTRELKPVKPLPVLVWIVGGAFQYGEISRNICSPDYIMMENVVLVAISYRVGPIGFLSLKDEECDIPGNAGLKDQILALKWVQKNCHFFGGDRENITVFGISTGAVSVHYLMMAEQTKNLFHKAVPMSGNVMVPWANVPSYDWAYRISKATGYKGKNVDKDVLKHLKQIKVNALVAAAVDLLTDNEAQRLYFCFGPCVEPYKTENCVFDKKPLYMLKNNWSNNIPILIGGNSFEGLAYFPHARKYPMVLDHPKIECMLPLDTNLTEEKLMKYGEKIKQMYFGDKEISQKTLLQYCNLVSYKDFWHGIHRTLLARRDYATAPTYLYRFDVDSKDFNIARIFTCGRGMRGVCHADELAFLFYNMIVKKVHPESIEYKTIRRMVTMLVKFATHGDPNVPLTHCNDSYKENDSQPQHSQALTTQQLENVDNIVCDYGINKSNADLFLAHQVEHAYWPPITYYDYKCLNISNELEVIELPEADTLRFWDSIYEDRSLLY